MIFLEYLLVGVQGRSTILFQEVAPEPKHEPSVGDGPVNLLNIAREQLAVPSRHAVPQLKRVLALINILLGRKM